MTDSILRLDELINHIGLSRSTIYDRMNEKSQRYKENFPKSFSLGGRAVGWRKSEIDAWLNNCQGNPDTTPQANKAKSSSKSSGMDAPKPKLPEKSLLQPIAAPQVIAPEYATPTKPTITDVEKIANAPLLKRSQQLDTHLRVTEAKATHWTELLAFGPNNLPAFHASEEMFTSRLQLEYGNQKTGSKQLFSAKTHGGVFWTLVPPEKGASNQNETFAWLASSSSYEQLGQRMTLLLNPTETVFDKLRLNESAARILDRSLTSAFNRILQRHLLIGPDELNVESFSTDISEVIEVLNGNDAAPLALSALRSIEKEFINRNTFALSGEFRDCAFKNLERLRRHDPPLRKV